MKASKTTKRVQRGRNPSTKQSPTAIARELAAHYRQAERRFPEKNSTMNSPRMTKREGRQ
jgi:hypothetical protein